MKKVAVKAPAKLNLALDVTGLLDNGYHTVDMVMQTIRVYERVEIAKSSGYSLRCPGSPVPADDKNTATKAARLFFTELGLLAGADIIVHKKVPTRAGMAGGSADAAAVLVGLNELYGARLTTGELCALGAMVGADVPFSILGGTARVTGIGEVLSPLPPLPPCWFVVVMPRGLGVSTPAAYAKYDTVGSPLHPDMDAVEAAIREGSLPALAASMGNALEHANAVKDTPRIRHILDGCGAIASMMTGSGAAVFGIFTERKAANWAATRLRKIVKQVFVTQPAAQGAQITEVK